jgi:hypothetical protein
MSRLRVSAFAVLFLSLAWTTVPRLTEVMREAAGLSGLSREERRERKFSPFYASVKRIDEVIPKNEPLALVLSHASDSGAALFFNYYTFPRRTKFYVGLEAYRTDSSGPRRIVRIDGNQSAEARLMPYDAVRAEEIGRDHVVRDFAMQEPALHFVVPIVSSGDGPPPDTYTTEGVLQNAGDATAHVAIRINPSGREAQIELQPGERRLWNDVVYQLFEALDVGWMEIHSDQPLLASFYFVSRPSRDADPLRFARFFTQARIDVPTGGRLWVLNPHDRELPVRLNEGEHRLPPRSLIPLVWVGGAELFAQEEWYAFVSWRDRGGRTYFRWVGEP